MYFPANFKNLILAPLSYLYRSKLLIYAVKQLQAAKVYEDMQIVSI